MGYSKRQFVTAALNEIGLANYVYDLQPEQLQAAVERLDAMMGTWNTKGIRLGYPLINNPENSDLDTETGVPVWANEAVITALAMKLAPQYGKTVSSETRQAAKDAYNSVLLNIAKPMEQQLPNTMPSGAGNKPWRVYDNPFLVTPAEPVLAGDDGPLDFE